MAINWNTDGMVWDFLYPAVVFALGVASMTAIYLQISGL
jgi:hypothetical protein